MDANTNPIELCGTVAAVIYQNEENGYTVLKLDVDDGSQTMVVGCIPYAVPGESMIVTGSWMTHPAHGQQFKADFAERTMPETADAIYAYLAGRAVQVDEGRVMFAGHVHKPFEILGRIAERYAVPAFLEGGGDLLAAFQGNFTLGRPAARQQQYFHGEETPVAPKGRAQWFWNVPSRDGWRRGSVRFFHSGQADLHSARRAIPFRRGGPACPHK